MRKTEINRRKHKMQTKKGKERNEHEKYYYLIRIFIQSIWHSDADV